MDISNKKLVLIGGGGHCKSVLDTVLRLGKYSEIVITDNNLPIGTSILGCNVVGNDEVLPELHRNGFSLGFISIGSIKSTDARHRAYERAAEIGLDFPVIVDPSANVASSATIGKGVFIGKKAVVNADVKIGDMSIINTGAIIEHGCEIGEFSHVAVGAVVCGEARIGSDAFIGANATIIQGVRIGMKSIIGAGGIIVDDIDDIFERSTILPFGGGKTGLEVLSSCERNNRCACLDRLLESRCAT